MLLMGSRKHGPGLSIDASNATCKEGHIAKDCRLKSSGLKCYNYKELGHMARDCQKPKTGTPGGQMKNCWSNKHQRSRRFKRWNHHHKHQAETKQKTQERIALEDDTKRRILGKQNNEGAEIEDVQTMALIENVFGGGLNLTSFSGEQRM